MVTAAVIAGAVGSVASGAISASGAESAAGTEAAAETQAAQMQQQENTYIQQMESPYVSAGTGALSQLQYYLGESTTPGAGVPTTNPMTGTGSGYGSLNTPFTASYMQQYSPAYQFQLQQGQQGTLNAASSGQGALSGAAQQALVGFNQSYANTAYNNAFNQYQTQQTNTYNRLAGVAQIGQAAASQTAESGTQLAGAAGSATAAAGASEAAGTVGAANAASSSLSSLGALAQYYALNSNSGNINTIGNQEFAETTPENDDAFIGG